ncbi:glycosyltransferase [Algoriphagus sp.]|uniref:glycosyltransferase n=1 Tax=Algoriphagus sp. TaxID=1872435 RepID=UPI003F727ACD
MFKHLLLTRFNVFYQTKIQRRGYDPEVWLVERLDIFLKYCFPSILNQSEKNFIWFFYIDAATPSSVRERLLQAFKPHPFIVLMSQHYEDFTLSSSLKEDIELHLGKNFEYLISSRVDSDDMLHKDYFLKLKEYFNYQERQAINFTKGMVYETDSGVISEMNHQYNAFISLIERRKGDGFSTVYHKKHTDYKYDKIVRNVRISTPMWCVVIHGLNDSTGFYGRVLKFRQPDLHSLFGFSGQKKRSNLDLFRFSIRSYKRTLFKVINKLNYIILKNAK